MTNSGVFQSRQGITFSQESPEEWMTPESNVPFPMSHQNAIIFSGLEEKRNPHQLSVLCILLLTLTWHRFSIFLSSTYSLISSSGLSHLFWRELDQTLLYGPEPRSTQNSLCNFMTVSFFMKKQLAQYDCCLSNSQKDFCVLFFRR